MDGELASGIAHPSLAPRDIRADRRLLLRRILLSFFALLATTLPSGPAASLAGEPSVEPAAAEEPAPAEWPRLQAEVTIRRLYDEFEAAWNEHNAEAMASYWAVDGDHYQPNGTFAEGRPAVKEMFAHEQAGPYRESRLDLLIRSVWLITPNVALVNGTYAVAGIIDREGKKIDLRRGLLTAVLLRDEGQWHIAASRAQIPVPLPYD